MMKKKIVNNNCHYRISIEHNRNFSLYFWELYQIFASTLQGSRTTSVSLTD